jgi:hypothetical protein
MVMVVLQIMMLMMMTMLMIFIMMLSLQGVDAGAGGVPWCAVADATADGAEAGIAVR